jgi:hypothetical protein
VRAVFGVAVLAVEKSWAAIALNCSKMSLVVVES